VRDDRDGIALAMDIDPELAIGTIDERHAA
jgi:hypothetical protein